MSWQPLGWLPLSIWMPPTPAFESLQKHDVDISTNYYAMDKAAMLHLPGGAAISKCHVDSVRCFVLPKPTSMKLAAAPNTWAVTQPPPHEQSSFQRWSILSTSERNALLSSGEASTGMVNLGLFACAHHSMQTRCFQTKAMPPSSSDR